MPAKCKGCGADILWIKTKKGKLMPVNASPIKAYQINEYMPPEWLLIDVHIPHWATCPNAKNFKRR